jgi:hypothetical protein
MTVGECTKQVMKLPQIQDINNRIYSEMFAGESGMTSGAKMLPKIEGFNCTWVNSDHLMGSYVDGQFTFASGEEKKVMKIIDKFGGKIIDIKSDLNQNEMKEINGSGLEVPVELVNEILHSKDFNAVR